MAKDATPILPENPNPNYEARGSRPATYKDIYDVVTVLLNQQRTEIAKAMTEISKIATLSLILQEALKTRGILVDSDIEAAIKTLEEREEIKKVDTQTTPS